MHDTRRVRRSQRVGYLDRVLEDLVQPQSFARDRMVQRFAGQELHGNEIDRAPFGRGLVDLVDRDDVRVVERGGGPGFLDEAPLAFGVTHLGGGQKLECHEAVQACVAGFPDDAHSAIAQLRHDAVVGNGPADEGIAVYAGVFALPASERPCGPFYSRALQEVSGLLPGGQQRADFALQRRVARARPPQERRALAGRTP